MTERQAGGDRPAGHTTVLYRSPWRIEVTVRPGVEPLTSRAALARLIAQALAACGAPAPASLGLILSDDTELAALNREAMGREGPTDVLSFPLLPPTAFPAHLGRGKAGMEPAVGRRRPGERAGIPRFVLPPRARPHLGDIVVSVERARLQAQVGRGGQTGDRRWDPVDEFRLLVVHGVLHVCGWDHADGGEARAMRDLELRLLGHT